MFISLGITLSFILLSYGQPSDNTQLDLEAIEAHFSNAGIVPSLIKHFSPSALLQVTYPQGQVSPGQKLTVDGVKPTPELSVIPANSSVTFSGNYTLAMADAGVVNADESKGQTRHWLVNGATVSGTKVVLDQGLKITNYAGPFPPPGSGPHRYVLILYTQPPSFTAPKDLARPGQPVGVFDLNQYVSSSGLGDIVAANYYTVEQGTASSSIPATSAVVTSTLPAPQANPATASSASTPSSTGKKSNRGSITYTTSPVLVCLLALWGIVFVPWF